MRYGDKDEAGDLMRKAMELEPKSARFQAQYAVYLERRMDDSHQATEYFKKAAATDGNDAPLAVNFGQHLCLNGQVEEGLGWLQKATKTEEGTIALRALFDLCAFGPPKPIVMQAVRAKLNRGFRVLYWDIERVVEFVEKSHPKNAPFIKALAKVVTKQAPLSVLDAFPFWKKATAASDGKKKKN
jgi:tetratricopeptide (TPR) repeat protein